MPRLSKIGAAALGAFGWTGLSSVSASYLQVGGGGGGGYDIGGGGGAGGYLTGTTSLNPTLSYTVTVGAGGAGSISGSTTGVSGSSSQFNTLTASVGGGGGGSRSSAKNGANGASGGGGSADVSSGGTGTSGQGFAGGSQTSGDQAAGGGGASAAGAGGGGVGTGTGNGGDGSVASSALGSGTYAGGGGGGCSPAQAPAGTGGAGGGGAGSSSSSGATPGTANTGGGGGGGSNQAAPGSNGANGGSGVVIISYLGAQQFGGGVVTSSGGYTIHTFNTSGTLAPISSLSASYLVVGGGGGGSFNTVTGGGAGSGGTSTGSGLTIDTNSTYLVTVGAGGTKSSNNAFGENGTAGSISSFFGKVTSPPTYGAAGTSGTSGNGYAGGSNATNGSGGGGGASAVGSNASGNNGGAGGAGITSLISGISTQYAGGGSGGSDTGTATAAVYNGGVGASNAANGVDAPANYGGGGGGGRSGYFTGSYYASSNGGSGIVIISYAGATQYMAGGTVTISGGNVIHTFTSSGYLAPLKYVGNSLRFRYSAGAYLNRTPTVSSNRTTWTYSYWFKGMNVTASVDYWALTAFSDGNNYTAIRHHNGSYIDVLSFNGGSAVSIVKTANLFRDPAAWNHMVIVFDTSNATQANRIQIYQNGVRCAIQAGATYPAGGSPTGWVNAASTVNYIGTQSTEYFDGYMTEINMIDGQALTPNSFGTFNSYGVWQPITYGGSYGTNGFYLPFKGDTNYGGSFNGSSQYLTVTSSTAFDFGSGNFTIEGWFYAISKPVQHQAIIQKGSPTTNNAYDWRLYWGDTSNNEIWFDCGAFSFSGFATSNNLTLNAWNHIAVVRSGSSAYMFLNGQSAYGATTASGSINNTYSTVVLGAANLGGAGQTYFYGNMSNVRIVKGTAVYTTPFTPSITPLTAITNTQLLTLQNATIVDNSTNAFSITNTGTVTVGQQLPFTMLGGYSKDYSPAGNNWSNNNIGYLSGSTLDVMTDVPTLTSTTVANYCTINPLLDLQTYATYSNANLTINTTALNGYAMRMLSKGTMPIPSTGKWYFTIYASNCQVLIGCDDPNRTQYGNILLSTNVGYTSAGAVVLNGTTVTTVTSFTSTDEVGFAIDMGASTVGIYKNGALLYTVTSAITSTFTYYPMTSPNSSSTTYSASWNFGQQPFANAAPSGYLALNTYNI
jgi:hypothetical protein